MPYQANILINFTTMALIVLGGLGFPVWWDILYTWKKYWGKRFTPRKLFSKLSLHSKVVISMTVLLLFGGSLVVFLLEYTNPATIGELPLWQKILAALFQSVTTRTAGFFSVPQEALRDTTSFLCLILMFIGGSPSGTAGGVKTTTVAMMILAVISIIQGKEDTESFHRKIPEHLVKKGMAVVLISLGVLILSLTSLSLVQEGEFLDIFYECMSALATVGLSKDLTTYLNPAGKLVIIATMYIGRIGPITLALFFNRSRKKGQLRTLPEGSILVG
jgi:trk system potassium uptake protein TrkH